MGKLRFTSCIDSDELARRHRRVLEIRYEIAESLGHSALEAIDNGEYLTDHGLVDWSAQIKTAEAAKISIPPDASLPELTPPANAARYAETVVSIPDRYGRTAKTNVAKPPTANRRVVRLVG